MHALASILGFDAGRENEHRLTLPGSGKQGTWDAGLAISCVPFLYWFWRFLTQDRGFANGFSPGIIKGEFKWLRGIIAEFEVDVMRFAVIFALCMFATISLSAQTKTVTNSDLEKFREKRVAAERDYRENYAKMGFPSPEELERQSEKSRVERQELSAQLRAERLERERNNALQAEAARRQTETVYFVTPDGGNDAGAYIYFQRGPRWWPGPDWRPVVRYPYPDNIGNGIPLVNYYGVPRPTVRPTKFSRAN